MSFNIAVFKPFITVSIYYVLVCDIIIFEVSVTTSAHKYRAQIPLFGAVSIKMMGDD